MGAPKRGGGGRRRGWHLLGPAALKGEGATMPCSPPRVPVPALILPVLAPILPAALLAAAELPPPQHPAGLLPPILPHAGTVGTAHATPPALATLGPAHPARLASPPGHPPALPLLAPLKSCPDLSSWHGSVQNNPGLFPWDLPGNGDTASRPGCPCRRCGWSQTGSEGNGWARASPGWRGGRGGQVWAVGVLG